MIYYLLVERNLEKWASTHLLKGPVKLPPGATSWSALSASTFSWSAESGRKATAASVSRRPSLSSDNRSVLELKKKASFFKDVFFFVINIPNPPSSPATRVKPAHPREKHAHLRANHPLCPLSYLKGSPLRSLNFIYDSNFFFARIIPSWVAADIWIRYGDR